MGLRMDTRRARPPDSQLHDPGRAHGARSRGRDRHARARGPHQRPDARGDLRSAPAHSRLRRGARRERRLCDRAACSRRGDSRGVSASTARDGAFVQSLERGLLVIRALALPQPQALSDVARATGLSRAAARRFLLTLEHLGYVRQTRGRFTLTPRVLELGYAYLSSLTLPEVAQPHLERLVEQVRESSSVSVLDGDDVVYVARVPTRRIMSVTISVGTRFPAYATSMGRVLLSGVSDEQVDATLSRADLRQLTGR